MIQMSSVGQSLLMLLMFISLLGYTLSEFYSNKKDKDETNMNKEDQVNQPPHYNTGEIECIEYLKDNLPEQAFLGYLEGNTKKYLHRWRYKGKASQDLEKAKWYLSYLQLEVAKGETK